MFTWIKKQAAKAIKAVKKAAQKVVTFVKEHKVDIALALIPFPFITRDIKNHLKAKEEERIWEEKRKTATIIK